MRPPVGYSVRPATEGDVDAIDRLLQAYDREQLGFADPSPEQLVEDFRTPGFDAERNTWYVTSERDGALVAFVLYKDSEPGEAGSQGFGRVDPAHQGRGLGAYLVDAVDARWTGSTDRSDRILHWLSPGDAAAASLFSSRGYALVRRAFHLERPLRELSPVEVPHGIVVRHLGPGEERELHRVNEESFAEHWGFRSSTFEEWSRMFDLPSSAPGSNWVAADGRRLVGELVLLEQQIGGWVEVLGVLPGWRGRGIGRALLRTGLSELARRGCAYARLGVDAGNESGALRLYEGEGMTVRREWHVVEKRLG